MADPVVTINTPANNAVVANTQTISFTATDDVGVTFSDLFISPYTAGGAVAERSFDFDDSYFVNPYTGLLYSYGFEERLELNRLNPLRNGITDGAVQTPGVGVSIIRWYINASRFKYTNFDTGFLNGIRSSFQALRTAGLSALPNLTYEFAPGSGGTEPTIAQWKAHIDQLAPIFNEFADVIFLLKPGGSGAWDEEQTWDGVSNFVGQSSHASLTEKRAYIRTKIFNKHIANRSLRNIYTGAASLVGNAGWLDDSDLVTSANAYGEGSSSDNNWQQTIHIDSFGVDGNSGGDNGVENGTKVPFNVETINPAAAAAQETFLRNLTLWAPHYVEGGNLNQFVGGSGFTQQQLIDSVIRRHVSAFNYFAQLSKPDAFMGGFSPLSQAFRRTVGYRLWLKRFKVTVQKVTEGNQIFVEADWHNKGSAGVHHLAKAYLEFVGDSSSVLVKLSDSIRRLETPRGQQTLNATWAIPRPANLLNQPYAVRLWLPGEGHTDPRYAIRVASKNTAFSSATGRNDLGMNISVL